MEEEGVEKSSHDGRVPKPSTSLAKYSHSTGAADAKRLTREAHQAYGRGLQPKVSLRGVKDKKLRRNLKSLVRCRWYNRWQFNLMFNLGRQVQGCHIEEKGSRDLTGYGVWIS